MLWTVIDAEMRISPLALEDARRRPPHDVKTLRPWDGMIIDLHHPRGGLAFLSGPAGALAAHCCAGQRTLLRSARSRSPSQELDHPAGPLRAMPFAVRLQVRSAAYDGDFQSPIARIPDVRIDLQHPSRWAVELAR